VIERIEGMIPEDLDRVRNLFLDLIDVMVSSLGDVAGAMSGGPMKIELEENKYFKPYHVTTARSIPKHYEGPAFDFCQEMIHARMMTRCTKPTE
jgi:hypothetical protein